MNKCDKCPNAGGWLLIIGATIVLGWLIWMSGYANGRNKTYLEAVKEGHAHWMPDAQTGKPYIEWNK